MKVEYCKSASTILIFTRLHSNQYVFFKIALLKVTSCNGMFLKMQKSILLPEKIVEERIVVLN
jgi:hypothetical protein